MSYDDSDDCRRCYICSAFFADRVKLGVHLLRCYHEAVHVRGELWHPHPSDLMEKDENYTAYMRKNRQRALEEEQRLLQQQNVAVATAPDFDRVRAALNGKVDARPHLRPVSKQQAREQGMPPSPGAFPQQRRAPSPSQQQQHQERLPSNGPVRDVGGFARHNAQAQYNPPPMQHNQGYGQSPQGSPERGPSRGKPQPIDDGGFGAALDALSGSKIDRKVHVKSPHNDRPDTAASGTPTSDGLIECSGCGKRMGKKGFAAHAPRCGKDPVGDFTFSRDARRGDAVPVGGESGNNDDSAGPQPSQPWTQFMVTYPRPVLEEEPKTAQQRGKDAISQQQKREMRWEMEKANDPRWQQQPENMKRCPNCHKMFNGDQVQKHQVVCTAVPRPF